MNIEQKIKELEARQLELLGSPRQVPKARTPEEWQEAEQIGEEIEALKKQIKILKAEKYFLPVSKLAKNTVKMINEKGQNILNVDKRKNINVSLFIGRYDDSVTLPREKYNLFLDSVQMTIGSLMDCGAEYITAEQVIRTMNGLSSKDKVTPQAVKDMENVFMKMRNLWVTIDRTAELKAYKKLSGFSVIQNKSILPINTFITIKNQAGREITAYKPEYLPPLYQYSKDREEIRSLPAELLKINGLTTSAQNTALKIWLLQQIESMKPGRTGKHRETTININTMFDALKYDIEFYSGNPRQTKARYLKQIKTMLDTWKEKKYINGYKENIKARSVESITIFLKA